MKEIYQSSVKEVLGQMGSREEGLTIKEVEKSREKCGWNELAEGKKKSVLQIFFKSKSLIFRSTGISLCTAFYNTINTGEIGLQINVTDNFSH